MDYNKQKFVHTTPDYSNEQKNPGPVNSNGGI